MAAQVNKDTGEVRNSSSPFCVGVVRKGRKFLVKDYISYKEIESVANGYDPKHPEQFIIEKKIVEKERVPIREYVGSFESQVGLKNLLKGIVSNKQMDDLISRTGSTGPDVDLTSIPSDSFEIEQMISNIDRVWESIPAELRGDLTKEEFLKSMTQDKLKKYIDGEIKKLTPDEKKEGEK